MTSLADRLADARRRVEATPDDQATVVEATALVNELGMHAKRVLSWLAKGNLYEAAAYADDCGNIASCIVDAQQDNGFSSAIAVVADLPSRRELEPLVLAPVDAGRDSQAVERWITACVIHAPLEDRLAAISALKDRQPTQRRWTTLSTPLTDAAIGQLDDRLQSVLESDDEQALCNMQQQLVDMGVTTEGRGAKAVMHIESRLQKIATVSQAGRVHETALKMHCAWAAMDPEEARAQLKIWQVLGDSTEIEATSQVIANPPIAWLKALQARDDAKRKSGAMVDDLERALDENRPMDDLERRYANLQRMEVTVPNHVITRLSHKITEHRASRRRRWTVSMGVVAAIAVVVIVAILVGDRARRQEVLAANVERAVTDQLTADDPHNAQQTLQDAIAAGHIDATLGESIGARIERHRQGWVERFNTARDHFSQATALLGEDDSEANFDAIDDALDQAKAALPKKGADLDFDAARSQVRERRMAWRTARRLELQPRFEALNALRSSTEPSPRDAAAWAERQQAFAQGLSELNSIASLPIAAESDVQTTIQQLRTTLNKGHEKAAGVVDGLEQAGVLLTQLQKMPANETAWAGTWTALVDTHAQMLTGLLPLKDWHDGRRDAIAAAAVQHWREQVVPELLVAGLLGTGPRAADSAVASDRVREHLELTESTSTPYLNVANRLLANAGGDSVSDTALDALLDARLTDLYRLPLNSGGVLYRRGMLNANDQTAHAIVGTEDLSVPVGELVGATLPDGTLPAGSLMAVAESVLLEQAIKAIADGAPASKSMLALLEQLETIPDGDPVINAHIRLAVLRAIRTMLGDAGKDSALDKWLDTAARSDSPLRENWPRVSYRGTKSDRRALIRGLARIVAEAPTPLALQDAMEAPMQSFQHDARAAAPSGILLYSADGWTTIGTMPADPFLIRVMPGQGTQFIKLKVEPSGRISPPANLPPVPTLIFSRG